ncbi:penicillin acylase family protein, partial [Microbacterium sp.]|uniref:penicillin acylase family protein n=1 Tax=Microbacterium sp. TaxID=51671 RepID=UPI002D77DD5B
MLKTQTDSDTDHPAFIEPAAQPQPRKSSVGRKIGITLYSIVAGIVVIALIAVGAIVWTIQRSFPQLDGELVLSGLNGEVTVQRDELGIPVITATDTHDLFFAQGFVHAQDRFWEMDFRRHVTSGRLSELFGESQLGTDMFLRTLGWRQIAEQEVELLDETTRAYYEAYADGVNAYLAGHKGPDASFEYAVLGLQNSDYKIEPWTAADSVAWLKAMAWDLRSNIEEETERAIVASEFTEAQMATLYPSYPFDRNPVIVSEISENAPAPSETVSPINPEAADADAEAEGEGGDATGAVAADVTASAAASVSSEVSAASAAIDWRSVSEVIESVSDLVGPVGEGIGS